MEKSVSISVGVDTSSVLRGFEALKRDMASIGADVSASFNTSLKDGLGGAGNALAEKADTIALANKERAREMADALSSGFDTTLDHLGNAFEEFARTGELNVKQMVTSMLADLARLAVDTFMDDAGDNILKTVINIASSLASAVMGGGIGGGGGGVKMPIPKFKSLGGPVGFGKPYVVGERGRELFVPDTSGTIVPNGAMGGGNITFNVQATDAKSFERSESQISTMLNRMVQRGNRNL